MLSEYERTARHLDCMGVDKRILRLGINFKPSDQWDSNEEYDEYCANILIEGVLDDESRSRRNNRRDN